MYLVKVINKEINGFICGKIAIYYFILFLRVGFFFFWKFCIGPSHNTYNLLISLWKSVIFLLGISLGFKHHHWVILLSIFCRLWWQFVAIFVKYCSGERQNGLSCLKLKQNSFWPLKQSTFTFITKTF